MRLTPKDVKRRLDELDKSNGETFTILVERVVSDDLNGIGVVTSLKRVVLNPDGSMTRETLIDDKNNRGDKDNAE